MKVKIDLRFLSHASSFEAGAAAMGLWLWGLVHARRHRTGGKLARKSALGAWGGEGNEVLAERLVAAGLWRLLADGDWQILNYDPATGKVSPCHALQVTSGALQNVAQAFPASSTTHSTSALRGPRSFN